MTIEVRQMVIKSSVGDSANPAASEGPRADELDRLREELLAECEALLAMKLRDMSER
jgi:hypothetical protein